MDRQERLEAVDGGARPRPHLESGRADQDEGDHGEDRHGPGGEGEVEEAGRLPDNVSEPRQRNGLGLKRPIGSSWIV